MDACTCRTWAAQRHAAGWTVPGCRVRPHRHRRRARHRPHPRAPAHGVAGRGTERAFGATPCNAIAPARQLRPAAVLRLRGLPAVDLRARAAGTAHRDRRAAAARGSCRLGVGMVAGVPYRGVAWRVRVQLAIAASCVGLWAWGTGRTTSPFRVAVAAGSHQASIGLAALVALGATPAPAQCHLLPAPGGLLAGAVRTRDLRRRVVAGGSATGPSHRQQGGARPA